ncbi:MAG: hypothetical protein IT332_03990 [Ardenticatenales bacterium]|nr:hypothetical protein [Ardenticatenales bacterium]
MSPGPLSRRVVVDRLAWIDAMLHDIRDLAMVADAFRAWVAASDDRLADEL